MGLGVDVTIVAGVEPLFTVRRSDTSQLHGPPLIPSNITLTKQLIITTSGIQFFLLKDNYIKVLYYIIKMKQYSIIIDKLIVQINTLSLFFS